MDPIAANRSRSFMGSLTPGVDSTLDDTSIMYGRTRVTASPTFAAVRPPDRIVRRRAAIAAATRQSIVRPVPPRRTGSCASSRTVTYGGTTSMAATSKPSVTGTALIKRYARRARLSIDSDP